jgi:hypothetical protein
VRDWKKWAKAALIRAVRTFAEGILIYIGGDAVNVGKLILSDVNWLAALSAGAVGFIVAILLALAGLPELKEGEAEWTGEQ